MKKWNHINYASYSLYLRIKSSTKNHKQLVFSKQAVTSILVVDKTITSVAK